MKSLKILRLNADGTVKCKVQLWCTKSITFNLNEADVCGFPDVSEHESSMMKWRLLILAYLNWGVSVEKFNKLNRWFKGYNLQVSFIINR